MTGAQIERQRAKERSRNKARLSREDEKTFSRLLSSLTVGRESIRVAMGFAFDHAESCEEIVAMLCKTTLSASIATSAPAAIARLFLISDLLHNSGAAVKNASNFRPIIQVIENNILLIVHKYSMLCRILNIKILFTVGIPSISIRNVAFAIFEHQWSHVRQTN
jgi:hypothetical protein